MVEGYLVGKRAVENHLRFNPYTPQIRGLPRADPLSLGGEDRGKEWGWGSRSGMKS